MCSGDSADAVPPTKKIQTVVSYCVCSARGSMFAVDEFFYYNYTFRGSDFRGLSKNGKIRI